MSGTTSKIGGVETFTMLCSISVTRSETFIYAIVKLLVSHEVFFNVVRQ